MRAALLNILNPRVYFLAYCWSNHTAHIADEFQLFSYRKFDYSSYLFVNEVDAERYHTTFS